MLTSLSIGTPTTREHFSFVWQQKSVVHTTCYLWIDNFSTKIIGNTKINATEPDIVFKWESVVVWHHINHLDRVSTQGGLIVAYNYMGRLHPKGVWGIRKGRHSTSWSIWKGTEICHFGWKRPFKGLKDAFYGCAKVGKMFWFCILFILNRTCTNSS